MRFALNALIAVTYFIVFLLTPQIAGAQDKPKPPVEAGREGEVRRVNLPSISSPEPGDLPLYGDNVFNFSAGAGSNHYSIGAEARPAKIYFGEGNRDFRWGFLFNPKADISHTGAFNGDDENAFEQTEFSFSPGSAFAAEGSNSNTMRGEMRFLTPTFLSSKTRFGNWKYSNKVSRSGLLVNVVSASGAAAADFGSIHGFICGEGDIGLATHAEDASFFSTDAIAWRAKACAGLKQGDWETDDWVLTASGELKHRPGLYNEKSADLSFSGGPIPLGATLTAGVKKTVADEDVLLGVPSPTRVTGTVSIPIGKRKAN